MKKNYYIQGDPTRADKIKAAFEKLGINVLDFGFADKTVVYCSIGECVQYLPYSINLMNILYTHPDYQELELSVKPMPKVGDWVVFNNNRNSIYQIGEIMDSYYKLTHTHGGSMPLPFSQGNFLRPWSIEDAKDGDVLAANECYVIFKEIDGLNIKCYCTYHYMGFNPSFHIDTLQNKTAFNPATKEQRDLLFKKMKEAGYEWDADKKELKKIQPHYDIANFKAGMPVLVRDYDNTQWRYVQFSHCVGKDNPIMFNACGNTWEQCIPFEGNETLLGTTDMCNEKFINW